MDIVLESLVVGIYRRTIEVLDALRSPKPEPLQAKAVAMPGTGARIRHYLTRVSELLFDGVEQVAGYCMYGSATELVMTFYGSGVHRFTLDPSLGEFIHIKSDVKIPSKPKVS